MLPTQPARRSARPDDLLGFKAHFEGSDLPPGLMPLLAFPGGYGGMAHCDEGRVSISCCVRRDWVARIRGTAASAGEAVGAHIEESCLGARQALRGARRDGSWLAVGPIRPGIRVRAEGGIFRVGNAAGEAHPVVAEGISMAMQSAWILARELSWWRSDGKKPEFLHDVGRRYAAQWRRNFAPRLRAASFIAHWAMRRGAVSAVMPLLRRFPRLLTIGARISGKATRVIRN
jgi:flavin-dependent dehydrogenase